MNSRLYFTITLVVLAWLSASTCRAVDTTTATTATATTATATTATATTATVTTANITTTNITTANITIATVAPALQYNNTVTPLETPLTNEGCGAQRLCASEPARCNPASGSCTLLGAKQKSGNDFEFILAGESSGYLAAVLAFGTTLGAGDTAYICFNDNGSIAFSGGILNGDVLTKRNVSANNVSGKLNGTKIQCKFDATVVKPSVLKLDAFTLGVISGTYSSSSGFGRANTLIKTNPVNLANPNETVTNTLNINTTTSPNVTTTTNTTSNAMSFRQTLIQALMISAGMMGLTML